MAAVRTAAARLATLHHLSRAQPAVQHALLTRFDRNEDGNELLLVPFELQIAASVPVYPKNQMSVLLGSP